MCRPDAVVDLDGDTGFEIQRGTEQHSRTMLFLPETVRPEINQTRSAWEQFVTHGLLDSRQVRPFVAAAWQRSAAAGCDARQAKASVLTPADTMELLKGEAHLIEAAAPFLSALSRAAGRERHAAMLGDRHARVLKIVGDAETVADENFPRAGSLLSEEFAGANGVGTALAACSYVELVGPEHYIEGFHVFTCQGVPLLSPTGEPAGVLSMSVRRQETAAKVRDILVCATQATECELLAEQLSDRLTMTGPFESVVESLRLDIVHRINLARLQLEQAAHRIASGLSAQETIQSAQQLVRKFRQAASVWRNLVGDGANAPQPICFADMVEDFVTLLDPLIRSSKLRVRWDRVDQTVVLDDAQALSQRALSVFLDALQRALPESELRMSISSSSNETMFMIRVWGEQLDFHNYRTTAPNLR
jgi:hypothetical protein